jgi:3-methyladenine DNA glycosylase AlkD
VKAKDVSQALHQVATPERAKANAWFFKTGPGQYGEGDKFVGVTVPQQRKVAKQFKDLPLKELEKLIKSPWHEERLTGLFILVNQYQKADDKTQKSIAGFYHKNRSHVNNWDLVDSSAPYILGDYLLNHSSSVLYRLAKSRSVWDRRIAIITTLNFIRFGQYEDTLKLAEQLLGDKHDLIQKAVGWMLREMGKRDRTTLLQFLEKHADAMPRTALRYAIEHLSPQQRSYYMKKRYNVANK